jgi:hypothetical protein
MESQFGINEAVVALVNAEANAVGESVARFVPAGSVGTVVFVHAGPSGRAQYEVEFPIGSKGWGHAVLPSHELESLSRGRVYLAIISKPSIGSEGKHVAAVAKDLEEAHQSLEERYGVGSVFTLHNEFDAQQPRGNDA